MRQDVDYSTNPHLLVTLITLYLLEVHQQLVLLGIMVIGVQAQAHLMFLHLQPIITPIPSQEMEIPFITKGITVQPIINQLLGLIPTIM